MKLPKIVKQLERCDIRGKMWIDAGCGNGTFTFPLASMVSKVIALDTNKHNLSYLESKISSEMNIETKLFDFNHPSWYENPVDGILFAFSLHYNPIHKKSLENAYLQLKSGGRLVVFEYSSEKPVPWVPHPLPLIKLISILKKINFQDIQIVENIQSHRRSKNWDNASYSLVANK
ncbi:MAG: class I SAM-dependent methyltransferase [Candidatus Heimdallarchaeota archaeon]|nr:class I SAM-dependent methyltransferase [Candidatus Heimdallarchaeota archaeon]